MNIALPYILLIFCMAKIFIFWVLSGCKCGKSTKYVHVILSSSSLPSSSLPSSSCPRLSVQKMIVLYYNLLMFCVVSAFVYCEIYIINTFGYAQFISRPCVQKNSCFLSIISGYQNDTICIVFERTFY